MKLYTGGTFDIPHIGHAIFFEECKYYFPKYQLIVALNTDEFVEKFKGKKPVFSYTEREKYLKEIRSIDKIIPNVGGEDSKVTILQEKPNVVVIGNDWLEKDYCKQMQFDASWLSEQRIALCYLPRYADISTTLIKRKMNESNK